MSDILLVHGSCHGAWCWRDLLPELRALGHSVRAIDLPGAGEDTTPLADVSLATYAQAICDSLGEQTMLVGHSAAGFAITAAAEQATGQISRLVYLCAYVPVAGRSMLDLRREAPHQPLRGALEKSADGLSYSVREGAAAGAFYQDCTAAQQSYALARLGPQPIAPQAEALRLTEASQSLPRSYIRCTKDQTIPPQHQAAMVAHWPRADVHDLSTGHSPFFAAPGALAALLDKLARK